MVAKPGDILGERGQSEPKGGEKGAKANDFEGQETSKQSKDGPATMSYVLWKQQIWKHRRDALGDEKEYGPQQMVPEARRWVRSGEPQTLPEGVQGRGRELRARPGEQIERQWLRDRGGEVGEWFEGQVPGPVRALTTPCGNTLS